MSEQMTLDRPTLKELSERFDKGIGATYALLEYVIAYRKVEAAKKAMNAAADEFQAATGKPMEGDPIAKLKTNVPKLEAIACDVKKFYPNKALGDDPFAWCDTMMADVLVALKTRIDEAGV